MSWRLLLLLLLLLLHHMLLCSSRWEGCGSIIKEMEYMGLHKILSPLADGFMLVVLLAFFSFLGAGFRMANAVG
jgi:hypothetical protein